MPKFKKIYTNDDGWSDWEMPQMKGYRLGCCECGLVHDMDYVVVKATDVGNGDFETIELDDPNLRVMLRAKVNNRSTAQMRRQDKIRSTKT